ncbi:MAG TPA: sensor histidine kinase [Candidatus Dormibacteraeota bacterium]|nr:sensor histidine kinase [Candidatus Dormibacteraeota bacterium]
MTIYYGLAVLAASAALLSRAVLSPEFGSHYPYHTVWLAIIFVAWYCGLGPSILAVGIGALGIWYWFLPPYHSISGKNHIEYFGMIGFLTFSAIIVALGESNRRLFVKREKAERALHEANEELEERVSQRTGELERSNESARRLSARIMVVEDKERRRIGRALHDSLGQYLALLNMNLSLLRARVETETVLFSECAGLVEQCLTETRTISHLLHPPLLDELGFGSATRLFVEGFSRRSGLTVTLDLPSESGRRLPMNLEVALFRAVQEGLTNIHRYAEATLASISLKRDVSTAQLSIRDNGKGIPLALLKQLRDGTADSGVGIAGMRERLRELNGVLEIHSDQSGTILKITAPTTLDPAEQTSVAIAQANSLSV